MNAYGFTVKKEEEKASMKKYICVVFEIIFAFVYFIFVGSFN